RRHAHCGRHWLLRIPRPLCGGGAAKSPLRAMVGRHWLLRNTRPSCGGCAAKSPLRCLCERWMHRQVTVAPSREMAGSAHFEEAAVGNAGGGYDGDAEEGELPE